MDIRQRVIEEYEKFSAFLDGVEIGLFEGFSREELARFNDEVRAIQLRSIPVEVNEMIKRKKIEEYPELLGGYRFPVLKEIDFLSEEVKERLDKHLSEMRVGNSDHSLYRRLRFSRLRDEEKKRLYDWLVVKGIFEERFAILCSSCLSERMTIYLPVNQCEKILDAFKGFRTDEQMFLIVDEITFFGCPGCGSDFDFESLNVDEFKYKTVHVLVAEGGYSGTVT